ncbi:MAG: lamin tail domain-containing protein [Candidatus Paceibacterota bacterium]
MNKTSVQLLFFTILLLAVPTSVRAQLIITEVMYDPQGSDKGREWVEIYNSGSSAVNLDGWKINDGSNHILNEPPKNGGQGSFEIGADEVFILADDASVFLAENPINVTVIDTVLNMGQQEGTYTVLLLNKEGDVEEQVSYTTSLGANGDGNSLQRSGNTLVAGVPTPGVYGATEGTQEPVTEEGGSTTELVLESSVSAPEHSISAFIEKRDPVAVIGAPTQFKAKALGTEGLPLQGARYIWNFGDGTNREGEKVFHTFRYPGDYVVVLSVASGKYTASDRMIIRALPAEVTIASVGDKEDFYIELHNTSSYDLDISGWILQSEREYFILPANTILLANKKIIFSQEVTSLTHPSYLKNIVLLYSNSIVTYRYGEDSAPYMPPENVALAPLKSNPQVDKVSLPSEEEVSESGEEEERGENQTASLSTALSEYPSKAGGSSLFLWLGATLALVFLGVFGVFALRSTRNPADEFAIIEEKPDDD